VPGAFPTRRPPLGYVIGVEYSGIEHPQLSWVVFKQVKVVQVVPEEVCSYWFTGLVVSPMKGVGI
jgi:hypothetical protein